MRSVDSDVCSMTLGTKIETFRMEVNCKILDWAGLVCMQPSHSLHLMIVFILLICQNNCHQHKTLVGGRGLHSPSGLTKCK